MLRSRMLHTGLWLLLATGVLPGCGGDGVYRFPVHPTDGIVTRAGKPLPHAYVRFHPVDPDLLKPPAGVEAPTVMLTTETDEAGKFVMSTYLADDGIPAGEYTVTVVAPGTDVEADVENSDGKPAPKAKGLAVPAALKKYSEPATSPFKATVQAGSPNHLSFELE